MRYDNKRVPFHGNNLRVPYNTACHAPKVSREVKQFVVCQLRSTYISFKIIIIHEE